MSVKCGKCGKEGTEKSLSRCSRCKSAWYCSVKCQHSDWKEHKGVCKDGPSNVPAAPGDPVQGVVIYSKSERRNGIFQPVQLPPSHPIHRRAYLSPISKLVGLPILIWRHLEEDPLPLDIAAVSYANQIATYLMIQPDSGFADFIWQNDVGTVSVMREDRKPLTPLAVETIWQYFSDLLQEFGWVGDGGPHPSYRMNPRGFRNFCQRYKKQCITDGRIEFQSLTLPL